MASFKSKDPSCEGSFGEEIILAACAIASLLLRCEIEIANTNMTYQPMDFKAILAFSGKGFQILF